MYDSIPIYFLAKGIFCSLMLFLFGKFVEFRLDNKEKNPPMKEEYY